MEYKTVILSLLIMSLVLAQIHVEATKICCPTRKARFFYKNCRKVGGAETTCARASGCKQISKDTCPSGYTNDILENSGDAINEYCTLGCETSICGALTTLQSSDANEIVNDAVEQCTKACSTLCTKDSKSALETA